MGAMRSLLELLNLKKVDDLEFLGLGGQESHVRTFGGQLIAQGLIAASRTVDASRVIHSMHSYFLRPGSTDEEIVYKVEAVRDGGSFSLRNVKAFQDDRLIYQLSASFHDHEDSPSHSSDMPQVAQPESVSSFKERFSGRENDSDMGRWFGRAKPFDIRYLGPTPFDEGHEVNEPIQQLWIRFVDPISDDPIIHAGVIGYASDMFVLDPILLARGARWTDQKVMGASLDHSMWFHQPFRADEWLLIDHSSAISRGGRGLAEARIWTSDGRLVATFNQEALLRPPRTRQQMEG